MRPDVYFCYATAALWALALALYGVRIAARGAFRSDRVSKIGGTALVGRGIMDATYWATESVARRFVALGVTPNHLTWSALAARSSGSADLKATMRVAIGDGAASAAGACACACA